MGIKCISQKELSSFSDGEISQKEEEKIRNHISECDKCREAFESIGGVNSYLSNLTEIEPSSDFDNVFWDKVIEDKKGNEKNKRFRNISFSFLKPLLNFIPVKPVPVFATLLLLISGIYIYNYNREIILKQDEIMIAVNLELFEDFEVIEQLELIEEIYESEMLKDES